MKLHRAPAAEADRAAYLAGANRSFGAWGDEATFAWVFRGDAEVLLVEEEGEIVAGAGIVRRTAKTGETFAIMSGAWTSAEARGRGLFTRMIEEIRAIAQESGAAFLGFVRAENASSRVLRQMGAALHPAWYCRSIVAANREVEWHAVDPDPAIFPSTFRYTPAEWRVQFLQRPHARIECIATEGGAAIVESAEEYDRVHAVSDERLLPLLAARGRRLFWYTTRPPAMPCEVTEGFVATLPPRTIEWQLQNGDRM